METITVPSSVFTPSRDPLAGIPALTSKVALYIPTTLHDKLLSCTEDQVVRYQREKVAEALSRWFGGYTEVAGHGGWYSERLGKLIREPVWIIYAGCEPAALARCLPSLVDLARSIATAMEQEAVTLEIDGRLYFVPPAVAAR